MTTYTGQAPCNNCGLYWEKIPLTGNTRTDENGNTIWEIAPNQFCIDCGVSWDEMVVEPLESHMLELKQYQELGKE